MPVPGLDPGIVAEYLVQNNHRPTQPASTRYRRFVDRLVFVGGPMLCLPHGAGWNDQMIENVMIHC
jgi:hypothetical protein